ncbi:hypothetical protein PR048_030110 [Dryococelus australis]|uniref:Uncharacterized protein n=1 Tax=Dryococelus australis TaxID=614101 RepID=A0ABQ9GAR1_9NEOP|nr:hypothetical protein PR048_030110 [Dryococelus australis]
MDVAKPPAISTLCSLRCSLRNLAIRYVCNSSITVKNNLGWAHVLGILLTQSLHAKNRFVHLSELRSDGPVGNTAKTKPLCPTRRIYRGNQINYIIEHYEKIPATSKEDLKSQGKAVLCSECSKLGTKQTNSGLIDAVNLICSDLSNSRKEDAFKKIFEEAARKSQELNLLPLTLPRQKRTPKRLQGPATDYTPVM